MIKIGEYNKLKILREVDFGLYLDDGEQGILLPKRFIPEGATIDDELNVFIYHDKEERLIATTQKPIGVVGDIVLLKVVGISPHGAFLDNGLMKDLFIPKSNMLHVMIADEKYLVKIYVDEITGRLVATERLDGFLSNEILTVKTLDEVNLLVYRKTNIGYVIIINQVHTGILHTNDTFQNLNIGDRLKGYIKNILPDNKIDLSLGKPGYQRVEDETEKIIRLLKENNGYLPYHDKSKPEEIYAFFGMSKKTFKMSLGALYKKRIILLESDGIRLTI